MRSPESGKPNADLPPTELYKNILNPRFELTFPSRLSSQVCSAFHPRFLGGVRKFPANFCPGRVVSAQAFLHLHETFFIACVRCAPIEFLAVVHMPKMFADPRISTQYDLSASPKLTLTRSIHYHTFARTHTGVRYD